MAILPILQFPDPRLRIPAKKVSVFNDALREIINDMYETMYKSSGVGLAATQVGIDQHIFVMDVSETNDQRITVINAEVLQQEGSRFEMEGCLSVSGAYDKVKRSQKLNFRAQNENGEYFEMEALDLMAVCVQHEIDHLNGKLFIDHLSRLKQSRIRKKLEKSSSR